MRLLDTFDDPDFIYRALYSLCKDLPLHREWNNQRFHTQVYRKDGLEYRFASGEINFVEIYLI